MKKLLSVMLTALIVLSVMSSALSVSALDYEGVIGDANGDGVVTTADARMILKAAADIESGITADRVSLCDINHDGYLTIFDARQVLKCAIGLIKLEPTGFFKGFSGGNVFDTEAELIDYFNTNLNLIKTEKAGFTKATASNLSDFSVGKVTLAGYSTSNVNKITDAILEKISGDMAADDTTELVTRGSASYDKMSVEGEDYVSALTAADVFGSKAVLDASTNILTITIALPDTALSDVADSAYAKAFDVSVLSDNVNGVLTTIFQVMPSDSGVEIGFKNGVLTASFDYSTGRVKSYKTSYNSEVYVANASIKSSSVNIGSGILSSLLGGLISAEEIDYKSQETVNYTAFIWD